MENTLYYGDNLDILKQYIKDETVDLIYLDPPFNSKAKYNILYKEHTGEESQAQITAFKDSWDWSYESEEAYDEIIKYNDDKINDMIIALTQFIGKNSLTAYLVMMTIRLIELKRVLKKTGSIYLHCDPTTSHYLKIIMDAIFNPQNFRNEIVWCYKSRPQSKKYFGKKHDIILFYTKTDTYTFNWKEVARPLAKSTQNKYKHKDENGRLYRLQGRGIKGSPIKSAKDVDPKWEVKRPDLVVRDYLDQKIGVALEDYWQIDILNQASKERLGYPTQKPVELLERIIKTSSNKGDIILDPFCGCGTTISAAEKLNRKWIGIDITHLAINLIKWRLANTFNLTAKRNTKKDTSKQYNIVGEPMDLQGAQSLFNQSPYQFQWWACSLINARPYGDKKKGADTGIDGYIYFNDYEDNKKIEKITKKAIVQVKGGKIGTKPTVSQIRDLIGTMKRDNSDIGIFISLQEPTKNMTTEASKMGFYESQTEAQEGKYPKIQIITIQELLNGQNISLPFIQDPRKKAEKYINPEQYDYIANG